MAYVRLDSRHHSTSTDRRFPSIATVQNLTSHAITLPICHPERSEGSAFFSHSPSSRRNTLYFLFRNEPHALLTLGAPVRPISTFAKNLAGNEIGNLVKPGFVSIAKKNGHSIAAFVDGPNMLRKELNVDLQTVKHKLSKYGKLKIAKVFLDQYASDKLIEAVTNQGFDVVITPSDVDVTMAVEATQACFNDAIDAIAIVSRDSDFKPVLMRAKERGRETIVVGTEPDFSTALRNSADIVVNLRE